jgi:hypothetical protein
VVIPNKSLLAETIQKALQFNISCALWTVGTSNQIIKNTALLLLAIESLASHKFKWYDVYQIHNFVDLRVCLATKPGLRFGLMLRFISII